METGVDRESSAWSCWWCNVMLWLADLVPSGQPEDMLCSHQSGEKKGGLLFRVEELERFRVFRRKWTDAVMTMCQASQATFQSCSGVLKFYLNTGILAGMGSCRDAPAPPSMVTPSMGLPYLCHYEVGPLQDRCGHQHLSMCEGVFWSSSYCTFNLSFSLLIFHQWSEIHLRIGTTTPRLVLQACKKSIFRTVLSHWMERKDAHNLLMDITFTQEEELDPQSLQIYLYNSDAPITRFQTSRPVMELKTTEPFPRTVADASAYLRTHTALDLGLVQGRGFQIAFSYSGPCVLVTSIRLYYRRCPDITDQLVLFNGTGAGSPLMAGFCVKGAIEISPPLRECSTDGSWGPLQGRCSCLPGHQVMGGTCQGVATNISLSF